MSVPSRNTTTMAATAGDVEEFLNGPLVTWLATCVKRAEGLQVYESFHDGAPIIEVLLQIDPEPSQPVPTLSNLQGLSIIASRIKIFHSIIANVKTIYEHELGQVVIAMPDCVAIGRAPGSHEALEHLKLLILLLLGCAVQGPTKEVFITRIKQLSLEAQHDIVECIKRVTDDQTIVLTQNWPEQSLQNIYDHLRRLTGERDALYQHWVNDLGQELPSAVPIDKDGFESNHLAVELADWKARLRKQRQELEEKTELLTECKEELEHANSLVGKIKTENAELLAEARKAKAYRDEADAIREKAERADKLEAEAQRYRERLADTDFYRVRVAELREDNRVLLETREMLEAQLARSRQRAEHVLELEAEVLQLKQSINDVTLERDADRERMSELIDENMQLQQVTKQALQETSSLSLTLGPSDSDLEESNSGDNSLSEQLTNNAQARALKLELENRKLLSTIEALKESNFHESGKKVLELEKDRKKLELKYEQLQETFERLRQQNRELDELFKASIQENRKLQSSLDSNKVISDRQAQDIQNERIKIEELEKNIDSLTKEKQRIQILTDSIKKRADDAEKSLSTISEQLELAQETAQQSKVYKSQLEEAQEKITQTEKEFATAQREITRYKETNEVKDRTIDEHYTQINIIKKELQRALKDGDALVLQLEKQQENEQKLQELSSQTAIATVTIDNLQKDLISHKLTNEKCRKILEKLGLNFDLLDHDVNILLEKVFSNQDLVGTFVPKVKNELSEEQLDEIRTLQSSNENLQNANATLQVDVSTLTSKINSLQAQQTALQLANSQLVAEKEDLCKMNEGYLSKHDTLLHDQVTIRTLYEQLNAEYEELRKEQEQWKKTNRDLRIEVRTLKEIDTTHEKKIASLELEKEALKNESKSLSNLRTEHSKLKDDFRNLFTANDRLKTEYKAMQEENKSLKSESWRLRLGNSEMQGELNTRSDVVGSLQLENAKLRQHCDILLDMNHNLDTDRRALMDHVSKLLSQYHSLLMHSLEDKQHYHMEEKHFTDKLNSLCRQKEKLEEKIMEHYRKLDNASGKKRGFGATLARRMRRATEALNKIPNRNRRSWHEDTIRLTQSGDSGGNESDSTAEEKPTTAETLKRAAVGSLKPRDEIALRRSHRDLSSHRNSIAGESAPLSLGSVGTRRTVYLSEDDPNTTVATATNTSTTVANSNGGSAGGNSNSPLVIYNRVSAVIGAQAVPNTATATVPAGEPEKKTANSASSEQLRTDSNAKENAICVDSQDDLSSDE